MLLECLKFIARLTVNVAILLGVSIPLQFIGLFILAVVVPLHRYKQDKIANPTAEDLKLPYYVRWFDNADIYVGRDYSTYKKVATDNWFWHWVWLAWRNPTNYFGYAYLGTEIIYNDIIKVVSYKAPGNDVAVSDYASEVGNNTGKIPGFFYIEITTKTKTYYEYYYIKKWTLFKYSLCLRVRIGWKIGQAVVAENKWCQGVCVIWPFMPYWGK